MTLAAVVQLCSSGFIAENLSASRSIIQRAARAGAKAIFLPEATDFIAPAASVAALTRSSENAAFVEGICAAAREAKAFVSVGIHEPPPQSNAEKEVDSERCYNTQLLIDDEGKILQRYRKLHLFDVDIKGGLTILESNTTIKGSTIDPPQQTPIGNLGLLTCYDLRFPEPSLRLRRLGAQILTYPAAFTVRTGAAHWEVLLRARAIETQCWVMAAAQVGTHEGTKRVSWGHAMIVDPFGSVVAQCSDMQPYEPSFCLADVDLDRLESLRAEMPLWQQRRNDRQALIHSQATSTHAEFKNDLPTPQRYRDAVAPRTGIGGAAEFGGGATDIGTSNAVAPKSSAATYQPTAKPTANVQSVKGDDVDETTGGPYDPANDDEGGEGEGAQQARRWFGGWSGRK
ncbi:unnamed protein product [Tilletia controversa]|uniref:CN hydrolase domain-containing protein n=3 Tax=Tilletia TaxID=13289 RepID=A0A8X7MUV8_9BASI|nr:hypothetical protein CF335_g71 [Tilletia laevis]KAE8249995.1 hypothetical protein A4X06_0g2968 [Tilletia controversa]CAD6884628.1 unnamed protein product [Tilletia caries]CAD6905590.1 unnamed protein product [Tilletia caries]CAD6906839.1 unnamed protein product [Tilletia caries]